MSKRTIYECDVCGREPKLPNEYTVLKMKRPDPYDFGYVRGRWVLCDECRSEIAGRVVARSENGG